MQPARLASSRTVLFIAWLALLPAGAALAADAQQPGILLAELLERFAADYNGKVFVDRTVQHRVAAGTLTDAPLDYPGLLRILRNNGLAAFRSGDSLSIVPVGGIRSYALPVLAVDDDRVHPEEWVTHVVRVEHVPAKRLVPLLRPLIPQSGHLAALPDVNALIVVDRYGNLRRLLALLAALDVPPVDQAG